VRIIGEKKETSVSILVLVIENVLMLETRIEIHLRENGIDVVRFPLEEHTDSEDGQHILALGRVGPLRLS